MKRLLKNIVKILFYPLLPVYRSIKNIREKFEEHNVVNDVNCDNVVWNIIIQAQQPNLFCLKNDAELFIFTRDFLALDSKFLYNFFMNKRHLSRSYIAYCPLLKGSDLYLEHSEYAKQGENCWKYALKNNGVFKTTLYQQDSGIYFKYDFLGLENAIFGENWGWGYPKPRRYVSGEILLDRLVSLNKSEQIALIKDFFDWFFKEYETVDKNYLSAIADCHFSNVVISADNRFYCIDTEYTYYSPMEKGLLVYYALTTAKAMLGSDIFDYFITYYCLKDKLKKYEKVMWPRPFAKISVTERKKREEANRDLIKRYFP